MLISYYESPIGRISALADDSALYGLDFVKENGKNCPEPPIEGANVITDALFRQLGEYFSGVRRTFDIPIKLYGTTFQLAVWAGLMQIPYGATISYGRLAAMIGKPSASRAVGGANHNNPISILVPCHRVIGSSGKLTGYGGGLDKKEFLLDLERAHS